MGMISGKGLKSSEIIWPSEENLSNFIEFELTYDNVILRAKR